MLHLKSAGRVIFATGIAGLAVLSVISKDFILGRPPAWPDGMNANPALAYIAGSLLIIGAIAIYLKKKAFQAALLIAFLISLLSVSRHLPHFMNDWLNAYKAIALCGGALIVAASYRTERNSLAKGLVLFGAITLSVFFIASGYAHFKFAAFVTDFIPSYIPFRSFWAYACGVFLFAGGAGLLLPFTRKWAALLLGIMFMGWFILLHIPRFFANTNDASDRLGL